MLTEIDNNATQICQHRISHFKFCQSKMCHTVSEPKDRTMEFLNSYPLLSNRSLHGIRQAILTVFPTRKGKGFKLLNLYNLSRYSHGRQSSKEEKHEKRFPLDRLQKMLPSFWIPINHQTGSTSLCLKYRSEDVWECQFES